MKYRFLMFLSLIMLCISAAWADNVAKIGENEYATLAEAIAAAPTDGTQTTITMIGDETISEFSGDKFTVAAGMNLTLDLNGHKITGESTHNDANNLFKVTNGATFTIKDSSTDASGVINYEFKGTAGKWTQQATIYSNGDLNFESGTLKNMTNEDNTSGMSFVVDQHPNRWGDTYTDRTATFRMTGGKIYTLQGEAIRIANYGANDTDSPITTELVIDDGEIEGWDAVFVQQPNTNYRFLNLTVNGGTLKGGNGAIRIYANECSTIEGTAVASYTGAKPMNITLNGGQYSTTNPYNRPTVACDAIIVHNTDHIDAPEAITEYLTLESKGSCGTYVAQIGDVKYTTLADAFTAANSQGTATIQLIADFNITYSGYYCTANNGSDITVDLNGKTVVAGTSEASGTSLFLVNNGGKLTFTDTTADKSGNITVGANPSWIYDGSGTYAGSYASNVITNKGTLVVTAGKLENISTGSATYAIDAYSASTTTVSGGYLKAFNTAVRVANGYANTGKVTFTLSGDATIYGYKGIWVQEVGTTNDVDVNISGGSILARDKSGNVAAYTIYDYGDATTYNCKITYNISGGYQSGTTTLFTYGADVNISGGTFDGAVYLYTNRKASNTVTQTGGNYGSYFYVKDYTASKNVLCETGGYFLNTSDPSYCIADGYSVYTNSTYDENVTDVTDARHYPYVVIKAPTKLEFDYTYESADYGKKLWYATVADALSDANYFKENWSAYDARNFTITITEANDEDITLPAGYTFVTTGQTYTGTVSAPEGYYVVNTDGVYTVAKAAQQTQKSLEYEEPTDEAAKTAIDETISTENTNVSTFDNEVKSCVNTTAQETIGSSKSYVSVKLTAAVTSTEKYVPEGTTTVVTEMKFDVKPVYVVDGVETEIPNSVIEKGITFRLPVDNNVTAGYAKCYHINEYLGIKPISGDTENGRYIELTSTSFSEFSYTLEGQENVRGTVYAGTSTGISEQTLEQFATTRATYPNAVMIVDEEYAELVQDQTNVIVKFGVGSRSNYYYECPKFVLTDRDASATSVDFYSPVDFTAISGSYSREFTANISSCTLPFALTSSEVGAEIMTFAYYEPIYESGVKTEYAYAYFRTQTAVDAATPVFIKGKASFTKAFTNTPIVVTPDNSNMAGTFAATEKFKQEGYWGLNSNSDKLVPATSGTLGAFRSLVNMTEDMSFSDHNSDARASVIYIGIIGEDGTTTGIDETPTAVVNPTTENGSIYNINGAKVSNTNNTGVYIINGKKVIK